MKNLYIHTISGKPAFYEPGKQIVFFNRYNKVKASEVFVNSLDEIRRQQKASIAWRQKQGFGDTPGEYGYIRIIDDTQPLETEREKRS